MDLFHCKHQQIFFFKLKRRVLNVSVDFNWEYEISFYCFRRVEFFDLCIMNSNSCQKQFLRLECVHGSYIHKNDINQTKAQSRGSHETPLQCSHNNAGIFYITGRFQITQTHTQTYTALIFRTGTDRPADSGDVLCVPVWNSICSECWQIGRQIWADNSRFLQLVTISFRQRITEGDYMALQWETCYAPLGYTRWSLRAPVNKH